MGQLLYSLGVRPGQTSHLSITLSNTGAQAETVGLSLEDLRVTPANTAFLPAGTLDSSNSSWITLPAAAVTVPAGSTKTLDLNIKVPAGATAGSHWSALIVQPQGAPSAPKAGVSVNTRYAVQLITTVPGGAAKVNFARPQLSRSGADVNLGVDLLNDGTASIVPEFRAEVYDAQGKLVAQAQAGKKRLYPGGGAHVDFKLGALAAARYTFVVLANDGVNPVMGARYTVNVGN
ncbi:hypothetical protein E7T09_20315 [Deinococcus sp. KSM4-11]|uniref:hypothetical protein n=1 Tax=Deinococcus sp. KSM4-11 TaxID=2568654 RepID=UPI0010A2CB98|nr:hypothetical protein [Deinococcus sp. KSM4-11]THF84355.1 hypothetical protein E7T09_20315 [Deinococcus sp. KSM4-11]